MTLIKADKEIFCNKNIRENPFNPCSKNNSGE